MKHRTRRRLGRLACAALIAIATIPACAAHAATKTTRFDDEFARTRPSILEIATDDQLGSLTQDARDGTDAQDKYRPVNPVPVSPQLGAATLTLLGLVIAKYRGRVIRWMTT